MQSNPIWSAFVVAHEDTLRDCIENEAIPRVYNRLCLFNRERDAQFASYLESLSFVTAKHLDIIVPIHDTLIADCGACM